MSAQLVVFCKHRLFRVNKFDFLVIQPASVKFPMNILMLFHDFRNIGRPSDFPGFGCQRLTPSWSGLLLKDASSERNQCLALCKLNQVGINICPKTMLKVTVWRHMISSWFWNRCCCELLFPPTIMSESGKIDAWNHKCLCRESKTILCDLQMMISQFQLHNSTLTFLPIWIHDSSSKKQRHALLTKTSSTDILRCRHVQQTACGVKHRQPTPWAKKKPQPRLSCPAQPSVPQSANQTSCSSNIILLGS